MCEHAFKLKVGIKHSHPPFGQVWGHWSWPRTWPAHRTQVGGKPEGREQWGKLEATKVCSMHFMCDASCTAGMSSCSPWRNHPCRAPLRGQQPAQPYWPGAAQKRRKDTASVLMAYSPRGYNGWLTGLHAYDGRIDGMMNQRKKICEARQWSPTKRGWACETFNTTSAPWLWLLRCQLAQSPRWPLVDRCKGKGDGGELAHARVMPRDQQCIRGRIWGNGDQVWMKERHKSEI